MIAKIISMNVQYLFVDMNSYFASVEQQLRPHLRGKPVAVVPMMAETTCCLAASYEAKSYGIKTGTLVREARWLCPEITFLPARTEQYVHYHKRIVKAVESVLPVAKVHSIDEMSCLLLGDQTQVDKATLLGRQVKLAIRQQAGDSLRCSVGLGPNRLISKMASDLQKPDGLTVILKQELPERLYSLTLSDFPGIGRQMLRRFQTAGVNTVEKMYQLSPARLHQIWGGIVGEQWWHLIRGDDLPEKPTQRRTVGHSHVLPPELRTDPLAYEVLVKLIHKAAARLRAMKYWAGVLSVSVSYRGYQSWNHSCKLGDVQDTPTMLTALQDLWQQRPRQNGPPLKVEVTLSQLKSSQSCSLPLFPEQRRRDQLAKTMDAVNQRLGEGAIYLAAMHTARSSAPDRIAFQSIPECRPDHQTLKDHKAL